MSRIIVHRKAEGKGSKAHKRKDSRIQGFKRPVTINQKPEILKPRSTKESSFYRAFNS